MASKAQERLFLEYLVDITIKVSCPGSFWGKGLEEMTRLW